MAMSRVRILTHSFKIMKGSGNNGKAKCSHGGTTLVTPNQADSEASGSTRPNNSPQEHTKDEVTSQQRVVEEPWQVQAHQTPPEEKQATEEQVEEEPANEEHAEGKHRKKKHSKHKTKSNIVGQF